MNDAATRPLILDRASEPLDGWDDPVRGRVRWRTLFSRGHTPTEAITCGVAVFAPGDELKPHRHAPPEVYYILEGEGLMRLDGEDRRVTAGTAVFIPGLAEHGIKQVGEATLKLFYAFAVDSFEGVEYLFPGTMPPSG
ncbi:MAG: cupin domain-containing protein [Hyphomicrobiales bacterium]|nr:cupin domain-containing protein [Hyphomicrobiales bacterium]